MRTPNTTAIDATIRGVNAHRATMGRNRQSAYGTPIDQVSSQTGQNTPGKGYVEPPSPYTYTRDGGRPDGTAK